MNHYRRFIDPSKFKTVTAEHPHSRVSDKYGFVPTYKVSEILMDMGWHPTEVQEARVKTLNRVGYQKHIVRFARSQDLELATVPEIVLINSHDRAASVNLLGGLWELVCTNGLVVGVEFAGIRIPHIGYADIRVAEAVNKLAEAMPKISDRVNLYKTIEMSPNDKGVYCMAAVRNWRNCSEEEARKHFVPEKLLTTRRREDEQDNLWKTFNVVQENIVKGSRYAVRTNRNRPGYRAVVKAVGLKGLDSQIDVNRGLWSLTDRAASLKGNGQELTQALLLAA